MKKLILIDGNSIAYRAFFALPLLTNEKGIYTNAVYGFTTMLLKILEDDQPTHILVAFDAGKSTFRHKTYSEYKGTRQKTPPELSEQLPFIRELLDAYGIKRYEAIDYEADDIIGTLANRAEKDGWNVKVISGDKDLLQLVTKQVEVYLTKKGITNMDRYDLAAIDEKYGITANQIIDLKGLMGDSSDNIPGVPGIGEKTALKLLKEFGSVETVLESVDQISGKKMKERLVEHHDQALLSKKLATIYTEVPVDLGLEELSFGEYDVQKVTSFFKDLDFSSLLSRLPDEHGETKSEELSELSIDIVETITDEHLASPAALVAEVLGDHYHHAPIEGFALTNDNGTFFIPTEIAVTSDKFVTWAKDASKKKWVFDAKRTVVALGWQDILLEGIEFDLLIASYLLDPSVSSHAISDIASRKGLSIVEDDEKVYGKGAKQQIPEQEILSQHLGRKASAVYSLKADLEEQLDKNDQSSLFFDLEMPLSVVLGRMETTGIKVDKSQLEKMGEDLSNRLETLEQKIHELAGSSFNVNSPKQLGEILFEKLGLPPVKKTKTGYSTSADVLEKLAGKHEIIEHILLYRQLGKLHSTYIEGLLKVIEKDTGRIHTRYNQALTQTGRLSSTDPNLQNIPIRLEEGRTIRKAFVPSEEGWSILAADYSQIELRVLADISVDDGLIEAFRNDMDIHTKTAMDVFHVEESEVTSNMRRSSKAVNFGIVYGISDYGLSQSLDISRKEAAEFIERYLESYPKVKAYMHDVVEQAREDGYVSTLMQRRRYLPELVSRNFNLRSFAERTAMNTPIQGTAADIIKKAMIDMANRLEQENLKSRMLLQVHDELIFEVPEDELEIMQKIVPEVMEAALELQVPLKADVSVGATWYEAK
ncbi:DNA polymerase I [Alkalicoccobacillus murimartini]|uniref:DNA polymerase I n=1 Tax=Alkalicoccobacillus murimartini TaxID=171685 RepID=A0ABT9YK33_9BACI|nr:DNA polymerase I [Alkalicoccobacillus murimartini]MDQ0208091.1 DNA polymerase-1 [Alkalicoccobacillus murimartini]